MAGHEERLAELGILDDDSRIELLQKEVEKLRNELDEQKWKIEVERKVFKEALKEANPSTLIFDTTENARIGTSPNSRLYITNNGNVGIGTNVPNSQLHIYNGYYVNLGSTADQNTTWPSLTITNNIVSDISSGSDGAGIAFNVESSDAISAVTLKNNSGLDVAVLNLDQDFTGVQSWGINSAEMYGYNTVHGVSGGHCVGIDS